MTDITSLVVGGYFDGARHYGDGPYRLRLAGDRLLAIEPMPPGSPSEVAFVMPTLVDAHVHVFLDGAELDPERRRRHLARDPAHHLSTARRNVEDAWSAGISIARDAGDPHGTNLTIRDALASDGGPIRLRAPGPALHRAGRYGSFLGVAADDDRGLADLVREIAHRADDIKVLLTGVVDFATGTVKGRPQFDAEAAATIVRTAAERGRPAFAHCNGRDGLDVAIAARFDSIEHGYGMDEDSLRAMAGEGIAWTPTLAPVAAQRHLPPNVSGFGPEILATLDDVLARHAEAIGRAAQLGVPLLCGSDAGGQGVPHGSGLIDEMLLMLAAGAPVEAVLRGATSLPRRRWNEAAADIVVGARLDMLALPADPSIDPQALRQARRIGAGLAVTAIG